MAVPRPFQVQVTEEHQRILQQVERLARHPVGLGAMISIGQMYQDRLQLIEEPGTTPRRGAVVPTGITEAVMKALPFLSGDFTHADVIQRLIRDGYKFAVKSRRHAVGRVLRKFALQGKLTEVKRGVAGEFSVYRVTAS